MKDQKFAIKISDLLNQTGKVDELHFEKKFLSELPDLTKEGISWTFVIQSLNETSLYGTLKDVKCTLNDVCDSCQEKYVRAVHVPEYSARFVVEDDKFYGEKPKDESEEEIFLIDGGGETIDIHDMVLQAIVLRDPIVKRCSDCEKRLENISDDDEDFGESTIGKWNISINFS